MNIHKRCQKNVANNCGINPKQIALLLQELRISDNTTTTTNNQQAVPVAKPPKAVSFFPFLYLSIIFI